MLNNSNKILKKIIVSLLILTLTYFNFIFVGSNLCKGLISYALNEDEKDDEIICEVLVDSKDIHKTKMEEITNFTENLNLHLKNVSNILLEDAEHSFYNNEEQLVEEAKLKYLKTTISKEELKSLLGTEGTFNILDSEQNLLVNISLDNISELEEMANNLDDNEGKTQISIPQTFIKTVEVENDEGELEKQEQEEIRSHLTLVEDKIEITYEQDVKNIKLNIENINLTDKNEEDIDEVKEINFVIENTKSIFDVQDLDSLNYLKENKTYTFNIEENNEENLANQEENEKPAIENIINFKDTITRARIEANDLEWTIGEANQVNYRVILDTSSDKAELFKNPKFILELPESVESVNRENSRFTLENDGGAFTGKNVSVITVLGRKYILIELDGEQTSSSIEDGDTTINLSLELNIKNIDEEQTQETKLYYQNDTVTEYESGVGFDTDEVNVSLVLSSEDDEKIVVEEVVEDNSQTEENEENHEEENQVDEEILENNEYTPNYMDVRLISDKNIDIIKVGDEFYYYINVYNIGYDFSGFSIKDIIPEGLDFMDAKLYGYNQEDYDFTQEINTQNTLDYNADTNTLSLNIESISLGTSVLKVHVKANSLAKNEYSKQIVNTVTLLKGEDLIEKDEIENTISDAFLEITKKDVAEELELEQEIEYELVIKNLGKFESEEKNIKVIIPEELTLGAILLQGETSDYSIIKPMELNEEEITLSVAAEETLNLKVTASYDTELEKNTVVTPIVKIGNEVFKWTTMLLTDKSYTPAEEGNEPGEQNEPTNPEEPINQDEENTERPEFDLSLAQNLKKITVTNSAGTLVYEYKNDTNFAKIEIPAKNMSGSQVTLEYEITVKNEGTIEGYARKIADYIPEGLKFNSELNPDWYMGDDKNLYSVALIDKLLNPEDTATLKLVLTKQMTNSNTGTIVNLAEIYEATNEANVEDINSTPGDKKEKQNDMAKVEVLIAVKTGTIAIYILLWVLVFAILIYGTYKIKKISLNKKGGC